MRNVASLLSRRIDPKRATGSTAAPGDVDLDAGDFVADADFEVGGHERGLVLRDFELDVLQNRLGAAGRGDGGDGLERVQHLLAVAGDFHRGEVLSNARRILGSVLIPCDWLRDEFGVDELS